MSAQPPPAPGSFVLSMPRTGSTLLRLILDTHPEGDVFDRHLTIEVSGDELMKILRGEQHPVQAQQEGKLRIEGVFDVQALRAMPMLFQG